MGALGRADAEFGVGLGLGRARNSRPMISESRDAASAVLTWELGSSLRFRSLEASAAGRGLMR